MRARAVAADVTDRASVEAMVAARRRRARPHRHPRRERRHLPDRRARRDRRRALESRHGHQRRGRRAHASRPACPRCVARGYGRIVLTSSITGPVTGQAGFAHYGASKAAMLGFMRSAAVELATQRHHGQRRPARERRARPGFADTSDEHQRRMLSSIPMGRYAEPEEVGWAVRFLASPEAGYITGQTLIVDGGQVLPEAPTGLTPVQTQGVEARRSADGRREERRQRWRGSTCWQCSEQQLALGAAVFAASAASKTAQTDGRRPEQREPDLLVLGRERRARRQRLAQEGSRRSTRRRIRRSRSRSSSSRPTR